MENLVGEIILQCRFIKIKSINEKTSNLEVSRLHRSQNSKSWTNMSELIKLWKDFKHNTLEYRINLTETHLLSNQNEIFFLLVFHYIFKIVSQRNANIKEIRC